MPRSHDVGTGVEGTWAHEARLGPKRQEIVFGHAVLCADALVLMASFLIAYMVRDGLAWYGGLLPLQSHVWVIGLILPIWLILAQGMGLTESPTYLQARPPLVQTLKVHAISGLLLLSALYLLRATDVSRLFMQTFLLIGSGALMLERIAIRATLGHLGRHRPGHARRVLIIGTTPDAARLHRLLGHRPHWGAEIVGFVTAGTAPLNHFSGLPVMGSIDDFESVLEEQVLDEVVLADGGLDRQSVDQLAQTCVERGLTFDALVRMPTMTPARHHAEMLGEGLYLMSLETAPQNPGMLFIKRAIDLLGACAGLVLLTAAFVILAPLVRLESRGPVIFRQRRIGRNGRYFALYKFRTMRSDAASHKAQLTDANEMRGHLFKIRNDPRITLVGRFLRKTYLDELPQFWNVLKGDMSLVGTRPPTPDEVARYSPHHRRRLSVRPGMTGLWQITGNGRVRDFEDVVRLDCDYIERWSIWLDLSILMRTCLTIARLGGH
jgi:exopolysaccharide biosynthesis polyprenyl glycosylphosphotransferase